jgi:branched-chain amino acid transport system permease protein
MDYLLHTLILIGIYVILTISLDLVAGHGGFISVAQAAFYGIGAYSSALIAIKTNSFFLGLAGAMIVAITISLVVSLPSLRLVGDYFIIATFGFQIIAFNIFNNWTDIFGGPDGIRNIPAITIFGVIFNSKMPVLVLVLGGVSLAYALARRITTSSFGRVLHAIREDEIFAQSFGKNTLRFKVTTFAVSAALAAFSGSLYAHYVTYIDPTGFTVQESILILSMVIVGGPGTRFGPVIGAILLVVFPEALRYFGVNYSTAANVRQIIYGSLLILLMFIRPRRWARRYSFNQ